MHPVAPSTGRPDDGVVPGLGAVPARSWYARPPLAVARDLLGSFVTARSADGDVTVRLTEVEAYGGEDDPGSHAYRGRTGRNAAMFAEPGRLYVYRHLGLHHCVNVVTEPAGRPSAVLLRAGEVVEGADLAWERRARAGVVDSARQLARGPARLAVCLGLDLAANGADLTEPSGGVLLRRRDVRTVQPAVASGPRVGVSGAGGDGALHPWRLWLTHERTVSAYRPAYRSPTSPDAPRGATTSA
ncbi:DNA-3-methyladenine glycosylase [Cellulomonas sp. zg-Y908]|uniref:Putative 3-methyladenine DNA glycosylase n=1 Tax=Cellulomonas wangsupingiae TaxID=2968085 RepID=A0ABY5K8B8_9CELL|nr:DNA-3-methyladenine glycosylase [Cellulomonas wangsupingiae]MCC2335141.1 DNA-3-methyladenine glycosylase [Cellulomonas wangsupingiae]UUI66709.1 DNA-3-methyladenine glycosylase [Cellulomonas wangsupingiae]